jgi:hypothetical protein
VGSNYAWTRETTLDAGNGAVWLRESSMHAPLFDGVSLANGPATAAVLDLAIAGCATTVRSALAAPGSAGAVGRSCAQGALARIPGGAACSPVQGALDPASFTCGGTDDLALAVAGGDPKALVVSRMSGIVAKGTLGADAALAPGATRSLATTAGGYEACLVPPPNAKDAGSRGSGGSASAGGAQQPQEPQPDPGAAAAPLVVASDGCGSSDSSADDGSGGDSSGDGCGSSDSSSNDSSNSDSCGSSKSSSDDQKSSDSCSSDAAPKKVAVSRGSKTRSRSPVSRVALVAAFVLLRLRRRGGSRAPA